MSQPPLATALVVPFEQLRMTDVEVVGGKNASLGEMISQLAATGVRVPGGFATTAHAYRAFLEAGGLTKRINDMLSALDVDDVRALAESGATIRRWVVDAPFPADLEAAIRAEFDRLTAAHPDYTHPVVQLVHERRRRRLTGGNINPTGTTVPCSAGGRRSMRPAAMKPRSTSVSDALPSWTARSRTS